MSVLSDDQDGFALVSQLKSKDEFEVKLENMRIHSLSPDRRPRCKDQQITDPKLRYRETRECYEIQIERLSHPN